ncbi:hypothetical protein NHQ30_000975 [Ciborinia camelliae]|nr:hypothetical protein NHQ30_000975 [Ciborinia camelliae]
MTQYHPYHPVDIHLSGKFVANTFSPSTLIIAFGTTWAVLLGATLFAVRRFYPRLSIKDQGFVLWFVLSKSGMRLWLSVIKSDIWIAGSIHIFFEGYFVYNHARMASMTDFFGQLWKEYALSDSRYMSSNSFLLTIETWTVVFALYDSIMASAKSFEISDPPIEDKRARRNKDEGSKKDKDYRKAPAPQESDIRSRRGGKTKKYSDDFSE